jgi:hypothetical protein
MIRGKHFRNFEALIKTKRISRMLKKQSKNLSSGKKVHTIVNYDNL